MSSQRYSSAWVIVNVESSTTTVSEDVHTVAEAETMIQEFEGVIEDLENFIGLKKDSGGEA